MAVITISRQYGSGGDEIVTLVCEALGYRYFDKQMMEQMVSWENLAAGQVADFDEDTYKVRSLLDRLRGYRPFPGGRKSTGAGAANEQLGENLLIWLADGAIRTAYEEGQVVIVGRGGQAVLHDQPGVLHVRIEAPLEQRALWVAEHEQVDLATARQSVTRHDNSAAEYVKRFYGVNWADVLLYHLLINTAWWARDAAVALIVAAARLLDAAAGEPEAAA